MPWYKGNYITFKEHPLYIQVCDLWDKWLKKLGYPIDINVNKLPKKHLNYIYTEIDKATQVWFETCNTFDYDTHEGLKQCWNYQGRHLKQDNKRIDLEV